MLVACLRKGLWMWDWRIMSPWLRRKKLEASEFALTPPPACDLHLRGLGNISRVRACWGFASAFSLSLSRSLFSPSLSSLSLSRSLASACVRSISRSLAPSLAPSLCVYVYV